jgi:hypothetical protein
MRDHDAGGFVPRAPTPAERERLLAVLREEFPRLRRLLDGAENAADGPDPESALVFLGMMTARAAGILFPT